MRQLPINLKPTPTPRSKNMRLMVVYNFNSNYGSAYLEDGLGFDSGAAKMIHSMSSIFMAVETPLVSWVSNALKTRN